MTGLPVYNVVDFGAFGNGDIASAAVNTTAFQNCINAASSSVAPGVVYVPPSKGFVVNNGTLRISTANVAMRGDSSMGSNSVYGPTSLIIGKGAGSTLTITGNGCTVRGVSFKPVNWGQQVNADAFILVDTCSQVTISDLHLLSPNIGISYQMPSNLDGEFWTRNILVQGRIGLAGILANAGNATVQCSHIIMYADNPQPPYGICVTSAGELVVNDGTDIINCGNCLAIVPGLGGVVNQHVNAIFISDALFDGGNGQGCVYVAPQSNAYILTMKLTNAWASTANNNGGQNPTNGFTFDGSMAHPPPILPAIQDVTMVNCVGKGFLNHCGVYAKKVNALAIQSSTFGGCYNGIQIAPGCTDFMLTGNKCGNYVPPPLTPTGGNQNYGILIEPNDWFIVTGNMMRGNARGGLFNMNTPFPTRIVTQNLQ